MYTCARPWTSQGTLHNPVFLPNGPEVLPIGQASYQGMVHILLVCLSSFKVWGSGFKSPQTPHTCLSHFCVLGKFPRVPLSLFCLTIFCLLTFSLKTPNTSTCSPTQKLSDCHPFGLYGSPSTINQNKTIRHLSLWRCWKIRDLCARNWDRAQIYIFYFTFL
jgi:hypothetical protein